MSQENPYSDLYSQSEKSIKDDSETIGPRGNDKIIVILTYVFSIFMGMPILFFLPLLTEGPSSEYARVHANNILITLLFSLLLLMIILGVGGGLWIFAPIQSLQDFWVLWLLVGLGGFIVTVSFFLLFIFEIFGFIWALQEKAQVIPLIGRIRIIK